MIPHHAEMATKHRNTSHLIKQSFLEDLFIKHRNTHTKSNNFLRSILEPDGSIILQGMIEWHTRIFA